VETIHFVSLVFLTQECTFFPQSPSQGTAAAPQAADSRTSGGATERRRSLGDDAFVSVISTVHLGMDPTDWLCLFFLPNNPPKKKHTQQCKPWKNEEMMYLWESWFSGWLKYVTWLPFPVKMPPYDLVPPSRCHKTAAGPSAQGLDMLEGIESSWSRWAKIRI